MAALDGLRPAAAISPRPRTTSAREEQPARGAAPGGHERHEQDGQPHDGADPAEEIERGDAAALEAERRGPRTGLDSGIGRRTLGRRPGQGSGYEPGALEGFWGVWPVRPRRLGARLAERSAAVVDPGASIACGISVAIGS